MEEPIIIDSDTDSDSSCDLPPMKKPRRVESPIELSSESDCDEICKVKSEFSESEIPVFATGPLKFNAAELVQILLDKKRQKGLVCQKQPLRVKSSKGFLVNTDYLGHPDDIKADDLGSWRNDGQHSRWVKVKPKGKGLQVDICSGKPKNDPNAYSLHRHYFVHHSSSDFKRKIVFLSDFKGQRLNITLLQYIVSRNKGELVIKPHGNSNFSNPYLRTSESTLRALKAELKHAPPKEAVEKICSDNGGEMKADSAGSLPRNRQQAYNASKQQQSRDPLYNLILECQNLQGEDSFVREVKLAPEPSVTMAMDYQISEIEAFCTSPCHHCVLGIDPTFDLGAFNVTVTTYKQLQLVKPNGQPPTFIGLLFIHYRKTFSCYNSFASCLVGLNKNLVKIRAFGTDGERPLIEAFGQQCHEATHLSCFTHCRGNIKRKLNELGVAPDVISKYLFEIFGGLRGSTFVEGLVDASSEADFDEKLSILEEVWNVREEQFSSPPQFFTYFKMHKASIFKETMIKPVRERAGLGSPPIEYHNNSPECMNNVIKMKVDRKRSSLDDFGRKMKALVQEQQNHLTRAITCRGEYRLHSAFKEFEISHFKWFEMTEGNRSKHLQRLSEAAASVEQFKSASATAEESVELFDEESSSSVPSTRASDLPADAMKMEIAKCTAIPLSTVNNIFNKAEELLGSGHAITEAPVEGEARMVRSHSNPSRPHLTKVLKGGKVVCDENCLMWASLKICSHCVAVAITVGCLESFVTWFVAHAKLPNVTKMTTKHVPKSIGKKQSHTRYSRRKGKGPATARIPPMFCNESLDDLVAGPSQPPSRPSQPSVPDSASASVNSLSNPFYDLSGNNISANHMNIGSYPTWYDSNWTSYSYGVPPYLPYPPPSQHFGYDSAPYQQQSSYSAFSQSQSQAPPYVFWVFKLNNRITTCFGCRGKFVRAADGGVPVPPLDLILKCNESRPYYGKDGNIHEKENSNTYYHPNVCCIKKKHPEFEPADLCIEESVQASLLPSHLELLKSVFNFSPC